MNRATRIARRKERRMEIFKTIMLMILKAIIDALGGGISLAAKAVDEKMEAKTAAAAPPKSEKKA